MARGRRLGTWHRHASSRVTSTCCCFAAAALQLMVAAGDRLDWQRPPVDGHRQWIVNQSSPHATDSGDGTAEVPFRTISAAAAAARAGDTVVVSAGVYREPGGRSHTPRRRGRGR